MRVGMAMNPPSPAATGLSLAITLGLLYVACALVVAIAPGALSAGFGLVVHSLDLAPLMRQVPPMRLSIVLMGLVVIMAYGFVAGLLFGLVSNAVARVRAHRTA